MKRLNILVVMMGLVLLNYSALAYDEKVAHPKITEAAIDKSKLNDYLKSFLGILEGKDNYYGDKTIVQLLQSGSTNEDTPLLRAENHFWNPLRDKGLDDSYLGYPFRGLPNRGWALGYDVNTGNLLYSCPSGDNSKSISCNEYSWKKARYAFYQAMTSTTQGSRDSHFKNMYESLGRIIHLMEDMGVPAHTRDDMVGHLNFTKIQGLNPKNWVGNLYEYYVQEQAKRTDIKYIPGFSGAAVVPTFNTPQEFWGKGTYNLVSPDPGVTITNNAGLAEYSNANFLSSYVMFTNDLPHEDRHYFPFPRETSLNNPNPHEVIAEDGRPDMVLHLDKDKDGEQIDNFVAANYVWDRFINDTCTTSDYRLAFYLDETVHESYAKKLIPRTIGYASGLINYFFRGTMSIDNNTLETLNDKYRIHLSVTNTTSSGEEMDNGDICLVIKFLNGISYQYVLAPELNNWNHIPRGMSAPLTFDVSRGSLPESGVLDLFVIYKGNLTGVFIHENDAVCVGYQQIEYFSSLPEVIQTAGCVSNLHTGCKYKLSIENIDTNLTSSCVKFTVYDGKDHIDHDAPGICSPCGFGQFAIGDVIDDLRSYSQQNTALANWGLCGDNSRNIGFFYQVNIHDFPGFYINFDFVLTNITTGIEVCREKYESQRAYGICYFEN